MHFRTWSADSRSNPAKCGDAPGIGHALFGCGLPIRRTMTGIVFFVSVVFAARWVAVAEEKPKVDPTKDAMQLKLELTQNILEGIAVEDFDEVSKNSEKLKTLAKIEGWLHRDTRQYKAQLQVFQFANEELSRFAKEKDGDGAALAYVQLTLSCVNCHKHLRDEGQ